MVSIDPKVLKHLSNMQPALYWLDSDPLEPESRPSLVEEIEADLCIVGAGYTGLWTALIAKERDPNRHVVILEAKETGAGASGRNGGFCNSSLTHGFINGYNRFKDEMEIVEHPDGLLETASACNRLHWDRGERLGVILTMGMTLGCSLVSGQAVGQIEQCEIWYPEGWEWVRQHELQHCKGYADLF